MVSTSPTWPVDALRKHKTLKMPENGENGLEVHYINMWCKQYNHGYKKIHDNILITIHN